MTKGSDLYENILEIILRFSESRCPKCGAKLEKTLDPMNPFRCSKAPNFYPSFEYNSWFEEILKLVREFDGSTEISDKHNSGH